MEKSLPERERPVMGQHWSGKERGLEAGEVGAVEGALVVEEDHLSTSDSDASAEEEVVLVLWLERLEAVLRDMATEASEGLLLKAEEEEEGVLDR